MKYITAILFGIILSMIGWYSFIETPTKNKEYTELSNKFDSLVKAKTDIDTVVDTIWKEIKINNPIPYKVIDTIWQENPIEAYWYFDTIRDTIVEISYAILSFGHISHIDINWKVNRPTIIKNTISYVDRAVIQEIWAPKRHLYIGANLGADLNYYSFNATYLTKKQLGFSVERINWGGDIIWAGGVKLKIF